MRQSEHMAAERMRTSFTLQGRCAEEFHRALTRLMAIHPSGLLSAGISPPKADGQLRTPSQANCTLSRWLGQLPILPMSPLHPRVKGPRHLSSAAGLMSTELILSHVHF